jgi:predicted Zn finger-like uncharacterized protein
MIVSCECGAKLKIDDAKLAGGKRIRVRCPRCGNVLPVQAAQQAAPAVAAPSVVTRLPQAGEGALVLIAHDSEVVRTTVSDVLTEAGFAVDTASDGAEALAKATGRKPQGMVLDVGLAGTVYGFQVCERLKANSETKGIKIVLLSSVYDMRRYKRTPVSLYGADDYIEKHHIPDFLPAKLRKLIFPESFGAPEPACRPDHHELPEMSRPPAREFAPSLLNNMQPEPEREAQQAHAAAVKAGPAEGQETAAISPESISLDASVFQKEECDIPRVDAADPAAVEKARRFARIIVSDIALYNQELVIEGITKGTFYDVLQGDIQEGRELYEKRVPVAIRGLKDYYQEAFDNFLAAAKFKK